MRSSFAAQLSSAQEEKERLLILMRGPAPSESTPREGWCPCGNQARKWMRHCRRCERKIARQRKK